MIIELTVLGGSAALLGKKKARKKHSFLEKVERHKANKINQLTIASPQTEQASFSLTKLVKDISQTFSMEGRKELQMDLNPEERERALQMQKVVNRRMSISAGAMGLAALGSISPFFSLLGTAAVLYLARNLFGLIWRDFQRGHYLSSPLLGAIMILGMLATGHIFLAALGSFSAGVFAKLISRIEGDSQHALSNIFGGVQDKIWVVHEGVETQIDFNDLQTGEIVVVRAGEVIPIDGQITQGQGQIDQHLLTGESQPAEKGVGEDVFASTLLLSGRLHIRTETAGDQTVAAKIGQVLNQTQDYKKNLTLRGRKIADRFLPVSAGFSALALPLLGPQVALTTLFASFGGFMGSLGPLSLLSYLQLISKQSILVKDGRIFESLHKVDTVVFDKTGTLTLEQPTLYKTHVVEGYDELEILRLAAAAEQRQPHPIARAITLAAEDRGLELPEIDNASYRVGYGIEVSIAGQKVCVGSSRFLDSEGIEIPETIQAITQQAQADSHTLIYISIDHQVAGVLEMSPTLRPEIEEVVQFLKSRDIEMIIISGDHEAPTKNMADTLGIDRYFAETLPEHKADKVKQLREEGRFVCFIGDGINDAIALKSAQVSISLKGASSAATDTAQIILMDGTLKQLPTLFQYTDEFEKTMQGNLVASFAPAGIIIGGALIIHLGIAGAMVINITGSLLGIGNALWPLVRHQQHQLPPISQEPLTDNK